MMSAVESQCNNSRNAGLDFIKGICIILVVLVHAMEFNRFPMLICQIFYAIFLNAFFCVSGWLLYSTCNDIRYNDLCMKLKKKFISLAIPYIAFSIFTIVWHIAICVGLGCTEVSDSYYGWDVIKRDVFCMISGLGIGTLWFLPVLFVTYMFLLILIYLTKKKRYKLITLCVCMVLCFFLSKSVKTIEINTVNIVFTIMSKYINTAYRVLNGVAYSLFGYLLHTYYEMDVKKNHGWAFFGIMLLLMVMGWVVEIDIVFQGAVCGFFVLGSISLFDKYSSKGWLKKIFSPVIFCGENSLAIMIYHYLFLYSIEKYAFRLAVGEVDSRIFFVVNLFSTLILVSILKNNRIEQILLGKSR